MKPLLLLLLLLLSGCATDRYLTAEEDRQMKEACVQGCTVVPNNVLLELLKRQGIAI